MCLWMPELIESILHCCNPDTVQARHSGVWLRSVPPPLRLRQELRCLRQAGLPPLSPPEEDPTGPQSGRARPGHRQEQQEGGGAELPGVRGLSQGLAPLDPGLFSSMFNGSCRPRDVVWSGVKTT